MTSAVELRAEVERLRVLLRAMSDPAAAAAIRDMIEELESRAKANGSVID
jgi:hypothetical protein